MTAHDLGPRTLGLSDLLNSNPLLPAGSIPISQLSSEMLPTDRTSAPRPGLSTSVIQALALQQSVMPEIPLNQHPFLIGQSPALHETLKRIEQVAPWSHNVMIQREPGTGKELIALAIHQASPRANYELVVVNCSCLSKDLSLSQLFGHEKGAFTGANTISRGIFELAHEGTLFLDELGTMPMHAQEQMLRVLEGKPFQRLGGTKDIHVDIRIITATNQNLDQLVSEGSFRQDLLDRLRKRPIVAPPLRDRLRDIPELAAHLIAGRAKEIELVTGSREVSIESGALVKMQSHNWPGNVRELRSTIESALETMQRNPNRIRAQDIEFSSFSSTPLSCSDSGSAKPSLRLDAQKAAAEKSAIQNALTNNNMNLLRAAKELGVTRVKLWRIMGSHGLQHLVDSPK